MRRVTRCEFCGATEWRAICTATGTTTELNLADYFKSTGKTYKVVAIEDQNQLMQEAAAMC